MAKRKSSAENITEESKKLKMNNEEEIDLDVQADKFSTRFSMITTKIE